MYNVAALGLVDYDSPLDSLMLTKPLLEGFRPTAIYGPGVNMPEVPAGAGLGVVHGGTSKFTFGCHEPPCPEAGVVDCRQDRPCDNNRQCRDNERCLTGMPRPEEGFCRIRGSVCDDTYVSYVRFVTEFARCRGAE
jgi:hypothetical protein